MPLACTDVRAQYGGFVAVDGVSLSIESGHILGVAGPNGAGKTTLFDVLSGQHKGNGGRVVLDGRDITGQSVHRRARRGLARTFQSPIVPTNLTVEETLEAARIAWSPHAAREQVAAARELAHFDAPDAQLTGSLDTLERRKLLLACLLMREPTVLLLDEPCSGLLQDEIDEIDRIIRLLADEGGLAIVVVEHRLELLHAVAETVLVMDVGKAIAEGPPNVVFEDPVVRRAYFDAPEAA